MKQLEQASRASGALRAQRLEYFTVAWNALEGLIAVVAGAVAGSISLLGFGFDSFIEVISASALLWRMKVDTDSSHREGNERRALKIVGFCFLSLAAYITYESLRDLIQKRAPEHSFPGIVLACLSLVAMPLLSRAKRKVARQLDSAAMLADAKQTDFCAYLAFVLLGGLLANAFFKWWWADPMVALVMVPLIANEGVESFLGKRCKACASSAKMRPRQEGSADSRELALPNVQGKR
jgi:divalent metal cation (Fe/Co/Zn/Cd) transporter